MKTKIVFCLMYVLLTSFIFNIEVYSLPENFYKIFSGNLDNNKITVFLTRSSSQVKGHFWFNNDYKIIKFYPFSSAITFNSFHLESFIGLDSIDQPIITSVFDGEFTNDNTMQGKWTDSQNNSYNITLNEVTSSEFIMFNFICETETYCIPDWEDTTYVTITYPEAINISNSEIQKKLNDHFLQTAKLNYFTGSENDPNTSIKDLLGKTINEYKEYIKTIDQDFIRPWDYEQYSEIEYNLEDLLCISFNMFTESGGAHPSFTVKLNNYNLKTGEIIDLKNIFINNFENKLNKAILKNLKKQFKILPDDDIQNNSFLTNDLEFKYSTNYIITSNSIKFLFNQTEIAPYVVGIIEVEVPYTDIKDILKTDSIIGKYIK